MTDLFAFNLYFSNTVTSSSSGSMIFSASPIDLNLSGSAVNNIIYLDSYFTDILLGSYSGSILGNIYLLNLGEFAYYGKEYHGEHFEVIIYDYINLLPLLTYSLSTISDFSGSTISDLGIG